MLRSRRPPSTKLMISLRARFRLDEIRILFVKIEQRLLERGKLEEIIFFGDGFGGAAAIGTIFAGLGVVHVSVVVDAVLAGVVAFVDVAVFVAEFEEPLHGADVVEIGGANEFVGGEAEFVPESAPGRRPFWRRIRIRGCRLFLRSARR